MVAVDYISQFLKQRIRMFKQLNSVYCTVGKKSTVHVSLFCCMTITPENFHSLCLWDQNSMSWKLIAALASEVSATSGSKFPFSQPARLGFGCGVIWDQNFLTKAHWVLQCLVQECIAAI